MSLEEGGQRGPADDTLEQRVTALEAENAALHETITELRAQLVTKDDYILELESLAEHQEDRIHDLEARLSRYENPNTPPSRRGGAAPADDSDTSEADTDTSDDDAAGGDDTDAASDSSPGRNPGHEGTTQPPPDPETTVRVEVDVCPECDRPLGEPDGVTRRVIVDIPHPQPVTVVEYELGHHECACGTEIEATHPDCPEKGRFGPHILAQTALLKYHGRLPHEKLAQFYEWQSEHGMSPGTVFRLTQRVADQLRPAYEDVKASVRESDVVYCDETGFPVDGDQHWVWTFVTDEDVLFTINESRGSQVLEDVLGEFVAEDTTLSCDGWSAYPKYHKKLQRCWAHLLREAKYLAERHEEAKAISEVLHDLHDDLTAFDEEDPPASARKRRRAQASLCLEELIRLDYETEEVTKLAEKIRNGLGSWLTFVTEPDVDSTNNRAERALREQVVLRKILGTLRTEEGTRIHETITTMIATWEKRGLDPPTELLDVLRDHGSSASLETSVSEVEAGSGC